MSEHSHGAEIAALRSEVAELRAELAAAKAEWNKSVNREVPEPSAASVEEPQSNEEGNMLSPWRSVMSAADEEGDILSHLLRPESPLRDWVVGEEIDRLLQEAERGSERTTGSAAAGAPLESFCDMVIPGSALAVSLGDPATEAATGSVGGDDDPRAAHGRPLHAVSGEPLIAAGSDRMTPGSALAVGLSSRGAAGDATGSVGGGDDPRAAPGRPLHLVLGDSIARDAPWRSDILCLARSGNNWRRQAERLERDLAQWRDVEITEDRPKGTVLLWLGSNDVYVRKGECVTNPISTVKEVLRNLEDESVVVVGPLPRGWCDRGRRWGGTKAYWLERAFKYGLPSRCPLYKPGHRLTHMMHKQRVVGDGTQRNGRIIPWFRDGTHLTSEGYWKISDLLPRGFLKI